MPTSVKNKAVVLPPRVGTELAAGQRHEHHEQQGVTPAGNTQQSELVGEPDDDDEMNVEATLQLTDDEIGAAQQESRLVQKLLEAATYNGMKVEMLYGLAVVHTKEGR
ncbi:hypothetical protein PR002_g7716 [Phytophthora rubi]|uniref:Uncharacterized protein n=1 Tax=Phytophthora rubi TaxID=129364 RepID=A0A6A3N116_9STRA|nr:hypothetical protein PR002_g7716 [Phytophthora rubi]